MSTNLVEGASPRMFSTTSKRTDSDLVYQGSSRMELTPPAITLPMKMTGARITPHSANSLHPHASMRRPAKRDPRTTVKYRMDPGYRLNISFNYVFVANTEIAQPRLRQERIITLAGADHCVWQVYFYFDPAELPGGVAVGNLGDVTDDVLRRDLTGDGCDRLEDSICNR